ncbi:MAG: FAD-dependent monooxygenase [Neisseriales bacterium]|nr:MAG: FAD-dependent monooxygenase [Neisseriales bacterium]
MIHHKALPVHTNIAIIGAGPVGMWLAFSLVKAGHQVVLIEATKRNQKKLETRALALSWESLRLFNMLGINRAQLQANDIHHIDIAQYPSWGKTLLTQHDLGLDYLGAVVEYRILIQQCHLLLQKQLKTSILFDDHRAEIVRNVGEVAHILIHHQGQKKILTADLAILAEGSTALPIAPDLVKHIHPYNQCAIAAQVTFSQPAYHAAYEYFSPYGPCALLPYAGHYRLLWIRRQKDIAAQKMQLLQTQLQAVLGQRLGNIEHFQVTQQFVLSLKEAKHLAKGRIVLVGAAAQTLHPIAGQGLNLGLRDAQQLVTSLKHHSLPIYFGDALKHYQSNRQKDRIQTIAFTHLLAKLAFQPQSAWLRGFVMNSLELSTSFRQRFLAHMVFGSNLPPLQRT